MRRAMFLLLLTMFAVHPAAAQTTTAPMLPVIVTQGDATLKRAPDRAWITVSTEARDPQGAEARRKNAEAMVAVQNALKSAGLAGDAIRTTGFSLTPEMDWNNGRSTLRGYVARNQIEVRVDNLEKLTDVIDAANSPKNVALSINGPRFDLKDDRGAQNEALRMAVDDAMARAQAIAAGARRSLGAILRIDDQNAGGMMPKQPMPMMMARSAAGADASTPITPGEIEIHAQISLTVEMR